MPHPETSPGPACCQPIELPCYKAAPLQAFGPLQHAAFVTAPDPIVGSIYNTSVASHGPNRARGLARRHAHTLPLPGLTSSTQRTTLIYPWTPAFFKNFAPLPAIVA